MMEWMSTVFQTAARPFKWWVVVAPWEQGLRVRLGKRAAALQPGPHLRLPFVDRVYRMSTRLRVIHTQSQSISTKDGDAVTFGIAVQYQVVDIQRLFQSVASVEGVLMFRALSAAARTIASTKTDDLNPVHLEAAINAGLPAEDYGISHVEASVVSFCFAKCYRFITGEGWIPLGQDRDASENSGEIL